MICVPCNLQFHNASLKRCPYCDRKLTEKGRPEVKNGMQFPDENDRGQREVRRPFETMPCALNVLKPSVPGEYRTKPSNRKLRLRGKKNAAGKRRATTR
jgi:hypothetical protein